MFQFIGNIYKANNIKYHLLRATQYEIIESFNNFNPT